MLMLTSTSDKEALRKMRKREVFLCPQCNERVILKVGDYVVPHFAHVNSNECATYFAEGESNLHLLGKEHLYQLFSKYSSNVQLEPYLSSLSQRPDLLVTHNKRQYPIEYQCSPITFASIHKRTVGYKKAGMYPIWIVRCPKKYENMRSAIQQVTLSKFEQWFTLPDANKNRHLLTYNPTNKSFHYFSHLLHITGNQFIGKHQKLSIDSQTFPFAIPKSLTENEFITYRQLVAIQRQRFMKSRIMTNRRGAQNPFLRAAYELQIPWSNIPNWVGIPVERINSFTSHPLEWQLLWIHFMYQHGKQPYESSNYLVTKFSAIHKGNHHAVRRYCSFLHTHKLTIEHLTTRELPLSLLTSQLQSIFNSEY